MFDEKFLVIFRSFQLPWIYAMPLTLIIRVRKRLPVLNQLDESSLKYRKYWTIRNKIYLNRKRKGNMFCTLIKTHDGINPSPSTQVTSPWMSCLTSQILVISYLIQISISSCILLARTYIKIQCWIIFWWFENNICLALQKRNRLSNFC